MRYYLLLLIPLFVLSWACKAGKYTPEAYEKKQVRFGSGGGFTGAVNTYCLLESGHLFQKPQLADTFHLLQRVPKTTVKPLFKQGEEMGLNTYELTQYDNMYKFLEWRDQDSTRRLIWGFSDEQIDSQLQAYYKSLLKLTEVLQ